MCYLRLKIVQESLVETVLCLAQYHSELWFIIELKRLENYLNR